MGGETASSGIDEQGNGGVVKVIVGEPGCPAGLVGRQDPFEGGIRWGWCGACRPCRRPQAIGARGTCDRGHAQGEGFTLCGGSPSYPGFLMSDGAGRIYTKRVELASAWRSREGLAAIATFFEELVPVADNERYVVRDEDGGFESRHWRRAVDEAESVQEFNAIRNGPGGVECLATATVLGTVLRFDAPEAVWVHGAASLAENRLGGARKPPPLSLSSSPPVGVEPPASGTDQAVTPGLDPIVPTSRPATQVAPRVMDAEPSRFRQMLDNPWFVQLAGGLILLVLVGLATILALAMR